LEVEAIVADTTYYPLRITADWQQLEFARLPLPNFDDPVFHDDRGFAPETISGTIPIGELMGHLNTYDSATRRACILIFHTAFCGSTLLARYFQDLRLGRFFREPYVFTQLAMQKWHDYGRTTPARWREAFEVAIRLVTREFPDGLGAGLKLHDTVNNLMSELLEWHAGSRGIVLYSDLPSFLLANLKQQDRRRWIRTRSQACGSGRIAALADVDVESLSDAQVCSYVWLAQLRACSNGIAANGGRLRSLNCRFLFDEPAETLGAICRFIDGEADMKAIDAVVEQHAQQHAKSRRDFNAAEERRASTELRRTYAKEIEEGLRWADVRCASGLDSIQMPSALMS
jgi:hypothetical protein